MTIRHIFPTRNAAEIFVFKYMGQQSVICHDGKYEDSNVQMQRCVTPTCLVASLKPQINLYIHGIHPFFARKQTQNTPTHTHSHRVSTILTATLINAYSSLSATDYYLLLASWPPQW